MSFLLAKYWQLVVCLLTINSLISDSLAKKHLLIPGLILGAVSGIGWPLLLNSNAPLGRSITLNCIVSYVLTGVVAGLFFGEQLTPYQSLGTALGIAAVILLSW